MPTASHDSLSNVHTLPGQIGWSDAIHTNLPKLAPHLWPNQTLPDPVGIGPRVCREYAKLIDEYWQACRLSAEIDINDVLDIIDVGPGSGLSAWLMVQALRRQVGSQYRWRYLSLAPRRGWFASLDNCPGLSDLIRSGEVVPLLWDPARGNPCLLNRSGRQSWSPTNPVVLIAHDRFSYLGQRLLAAHYGKLMVAAMPKMGLEINEDQPQESQSSVDWKILDDKPFDDATDVLMTRYLATFNSSPLPYPEGALSLLSFLENLTPAGHMALSMASGFDSESSLRMGLFPNLLRQWRTSQTLPVNFHMIAHHYKSIGGDAANLPIRQDQVLQIAIAGHSDAKDRLHHLAARAEPWLAEQPTALIEATRALGGAQSLSVRLALLRLSEFDPTVFIAGDRALTAAMASASRDGSLERSAWSDALFRVWMNCLPSGPSSDLHQRLAPAAMHCGAWGLARSVIARGMQVNGENPTDLANLAWCANRTGNAEKGLSLAQQAVRLDPGHSLALEVQKRITEKLALRDHRWQQVLRSPGSDMVLEPLHISHAEAFFYQYRDPQIAIMTGLPPIKSLEEARNWIDSQATDASKINYAIMLPDQGFAGFINLAVSGHAAFFCFWSGVDFQGRGLAAKAGQIAYAHAVKLGVPVMLTSAFVDNQRSIRALIRMGFRELSIRALPPDHDRIFFMLAEDSHITFNGERELVEYYAREGLAVEFPRLETDHNETLPQGGNAA